MGYYYYRDGSPMFGTLTEDMYTWGRLHGNRWYRRVRWTVLRIDGRRVAVSTIWLGLNHSWDPDSPPLIFETMIFGGKADGYCQRYSTEDDARRGHKRVVRLLRERRFRQL